MLQGECLCGAVRYSICAKLENMSHCHCSMCRKSNGTNFGTYARAERRAVTWERGEEAIDRYASSLGVERGFCRRCGAALFFALTDGPKMSFPAGTLRDPVGLRPDHHIFVADKPPWYDITDSLPQHERYGAGSGPIVDTPAAPRPRSGTAIGSCNCGQVRFEYVGEPSAMWNCHCTRCRRARGAAHATNVFVPKNQFRWVCGEGHVKNFKLPDAERFGQAFCSGCGSIMPRINPNFHLVVVPAGCLDSEPGMRPGGHIFVGSKAEWFDITGDLPQYEEMVS